MYRAAAKILLPSAFLVLFLSPSLSAQDRYGYAPAYRQRAEQHEAYDKGYRRGLDRGRRDARAGRKFDYDDYREYRNGEVGYKGRYGERDVYRAAFRRGFEEGYEHGYREYARGYDRDRDRYRHDYRDYVPRSR